MNSLLRLYNGTYLLFIAPTNFFSGSAGGETAGIR